MSSIYVAARRIRLRNALLGVVALCILAGSVAATGFFLTGGFAYGRRVTAIF